MEQTETRIGIIGFGSLMESLLPCCDSLLKGPREGHIFAVKGSEEGLDEKRAQYPFEITAGDPLEMLKRVTPQVILFSPPPALAEELTKSVLKPYYDGLRETGTPFPLLICFPPKPLPRFYRQTLGAGISQVTLMPCAAQRAGSYEVGRFGYRLIAMDGKAMPGQEKLGQLLEFSRLEDGRFTLSIETVDLKAEFEDAVYTYREFFRREGIALTHTAWFSSGSMWMAVSMRLPAPPCLAALSSRLQKTCRSRWGSASMGGNSSSQSVWVRAMPSRRKNSR